MTQPAQSPAEPTITERDMLGAMEVLSGASAEPTILLTLTDEEIMALDGASALELLGSPYVSQDEVDAEASAAAALRSLVARAMVFTGTEGREEEGDVLSGPGDPAQRPVQLDRRLAGVIALRRIPEGMVTSQRTLAGGTTTLAHYFYPSGGVLEEYVTIDGFHHFAVPELATVAERIRAFTDPFEVASEDGQPQALPLQEAVAALENEDTRALTVVTAVTDGASRRATVGATSQAVLVLDNGPLDREPAPTETVQVSEVSSEALRTVLDVMLPREADDEADATPEG
ncbi:hypothetical protein [Brachybacterium aquaticum]|uniref:Uncharacterized protein n=1 Tax=Brachybacterium aquaticum TaxID=1432564 RepID=A0A841AGI4_9MICO|nr:hypothetical protein [Brachybacterium aquaticum]MBB5833103.1 hypothetical protein [Brachybacterium aquaticum]